jgi:hypothetical protein
MEKIDDNSFLDFISWIKSILLRAKHRYEQIEK